MDRPRIALGQKQGNTRAARPPLAKHATATYLTVSPPKKSDPGNQYAAITASIDADDGRANALVRRYSALGVTESLI